MLKIKEFFKIAKNGLHESPVNQILVEECLEGWKEFEMEVVRDKKIIVLLFAQ